MFFKNFVLKFLQYSQENTCAGVFFNKVGGLGQKQTQVLSCEYCKNFKNSFLIEHLRWLPSKKTYALLG